MNDDENRIRKIADSAILLFTYRISAPLLLGVCSWIAVSVVNLKTDLASLTGTVTAALSGIAKRVDDLEAWRNSIDSNYNSENPHVRRNN